jgi:hypothetical protein
MAEWGITGILSYLRRSSKDDAQSAFGTHARPQRPGEGPRVHPEERQKELIGQLDKRGPAKMSDAGWARAQELLREAQERKTKPKSPKRKK